MRVIAGSAGGRALRAPKGSATRPTSDRVREAVFNALGSQLDLEGLRVLDLFAGTGALGIEALSRGAAHATFVDNDAAARRLIAENLQRTGFAGQGEVRGGDAAHAATVAASGHFDLAFCDPPYRFDGWEPLLVSLPATWVVIESDRQLDVPPPWRLVRSKRYGSTVVLFAQRDEPAPEVAAQQE